MTAAKSRFAAKSASVEIRRKATKTKQAALVKFEVGKAVKSRGYRVVRELSMQAIVATIRDGIPARFLKQMASDMDVSQERIYDTLRLPRATLMRKAKERKRMSPSESERALSLARLIGQAEEIVARSGDIEHFDAAKWIAQWLQEPNPALAGKCPADWMDTAPGRELVSQTLARMESGAYA